MANYSGSPNSLSYYEQSPDTETRRITRTFQHDSNESPRFDYSWYLPLFSSISINRWFQDNDESITALKKRVDTLEKSQNELLQLLNQLTTINTCPFYSTQLPNKDQTQKGAENTEQEETKPIDRDIVDEKAADNVENIKKERTESESTTIKGDSPSAVTPSTNIDEVTVRPTMVNEKETLTLSEIDDARYNSPTSEKE